MSPMMPPRACQGPGPHSGYAEPRTWLCSACKAKSQSHHDQQSAQRRARYGRGWEQFTNGLKLWGNVICQFVVEQNNQRTRCDQPAEITHHLLGAEQYPQWLLNPNNVVRVCRAHHPNSPDDPGTAQYIPTIIPTMMGGTPVEPVGPGERIPPNMELWSAGSQRRKLQG
jgi:hypothetical protein